MPIFQHMCWLWKQQTSFCHANVACIHVGPHQNAIALTFTYNLLCCRKVGLPVCACQINFWRMHIMITSLYIFCYACLPFRLRGKRYYLYKWVVFVFTSLMYILLMEWADQRTSCKLFEKCVDKHRIMWLKRILDGIWTVSASVLAL